MPADQAHRSTAVATGKVVSSNPSTGDVRGEAGATLVVAIDGPSGSGKSTVARGVAQALRLRYLDTGATYRALTWAVLDRGVKPEDADAVIALAGTVKIEVSTDPADTRVEVDAMSLAPSGVLA